MKDIVNRCEELIKIDSPSGFTNNIRKYLIDFAVNNNLKYSVSLKGNVLIDIIVNDEKPKTLVATHVDTLGLIVSSINDDGTLNVHAIGSPIASTLNGEYVKVYTRDGKVIHGTILLNSDSKHVYEDSEKKVEIKDLKIRLDLNANTKEEVINAGISNGDFVCYEPKFRFTNDFINSRFLDDKLCAAISIKVIEDIISKKIKINQSLTFTFSTYEEVGHGLSYVDDNITNIIALDMGCVGKDLSGSEYKVSICAKDSSGPYDYDEITKLVNICKSNDIDYGIDVYPFYGSDASAALRGSNNIKAVLIGPGIAASHGLERSHINGVNATYHLLTKYLMI